MHEHLPLVVVIAGDFVRRRQNLVHRRIEPAVHAGANQLAADQQHEHGRNERVGEQQQDELRPKPGEWQRPPAFDHQLDDVASQNEAERDEHGEIARQQRIQNDLAQEVG